MSRVEVYTQAWCPFCARAINLLKKKGVAVEEIDAPSGSSERATSIERSGGRTSVPQVFIDGHHVGGWDDLAALDRVGKLDPMLAA